MPENLQRALDALPLIAILRGIHPDEAAAIGTVLVNAGFGIIEVPLNSPEPFRSIETLAHAFGDKVLIGAGTVMSPAEVEAVARAGGRLIVMPHVDAEVIRAAKALGLACTPGVATPSEGFATLKQGADALKLFPAETLGPAALRAWRAVFPKETAFLPVGGITPATMPAWRAAGATGFGIGSALYRPGMTAEEVARSAASFVAAWHSAI